MKINLTGIFLHLYVFALALAVGAAWGAGWSVILLVVGILLLVWLAD